MTPALSRSLGKAASNKKSSRKDHSARWKYSRRRTEGAGRWCSLGDAHRFASCCWLAKIGQSCPKVAEFVQKWRGPAFSRKREGPRSNLKDAALALSFALHNSPRPCYARPHAWFARAMHHFPTPLLRKCLATLDPQWAKETAASADPFFLLRPLPYRGSALFWDSQQINTECLI